MVWRGIHRAALIAATAALIAAAPASAYKSSLYSGPGHRPGPDLLYAGPATAPQLTNSGGWKARPILVSGAHAYRSGEYLYQDFLYDDHGAQNSVPDPNDPKTAGNLFSKPTGTYTYPTDKGYANDAADLVEFRVKPLKRSTAFRVTLNTFKDRRLVAFAIALGNGNGKPRAFPFGANVNAPATLFLTVHPQGNKLVAVLTRARDGKVLKPGSTVRVDAKRRQITVKIPHRAWNPKRRTIRMAAGVGLWDAAGGTYLLPQASASATKPGGSTASAPAAFFNVAFRGREPRPKPTDNLKAVTDPAWWRDREQGHALAAHDISRFSQQVKFGKLARKKTDNRLVPKHGAMDRILPSHFELSQGADFSQSCIQAQSTCKGQYQGQLEPYSIYIPHRARPAGGWGMTLLMHSLSANYNQYHGSRNQIQFGDRAPGSIVITPEARGPDEFYENRGAADVFDVWNDVARRYRLNPANAVATGYSMGGYGTFKLASQFPDLFSRAQPTVGTENNTDVLASLRNVPVLMWNTHGDELVPEAEFQSTANKLDSLGYRYELDAYKPCTDAQKCSALFPSHLELAVNDQFAPAAGFLGSALVDRNPAHVTYVVDAKRNHADLSLVGDHAYWLSDVRLRDPSKNGVGGEPVGSIDARSFASGAGEPVASPLTQVGTGTLTGGNLGPLPFTRQYKTWTAGPAVAKANRVDVKVTNVASAVLDVGRAGLSCSADVRVTSDGPVALTLAGCGRVVRAG